MFDFNPTSKFLEKSEFQEAMMDKIHETEAAHFIIVAPCGCGKSAVIIEALMAAGTLGLILCYESQGVYQMKEAIKNNTNIPDSDLYVYSGSTRDIPPPPGVSSCVLITTYGMVADTKAHRNQTSRAVRKFVCSAHWDLVCCDEFHHAGAATYRPLVEGLKVTAKRVIGFTATLYRSEHGADGKLSIKDEEEAFKWFGPVAYRTCCKKLENAGLIAKIRRSTVCCKFTPEFREAHEQATGLQKTYLAALNPLKLNALVAICHFHKEVYGHAGIVFANHLIVAEMARECLGDGWAMLSGGAALGTTEHHSPDGNNEIVTKFNNGELDGMICTAVGESSMDVHTERFCYVCVLEADSGIASAGQRLGRVARSERINVKDGESPEELVDRRRAEQKNAAYYDLLTDCEADLNAAKHRQRLFDAEGYDAVKNLPYDQVMQQAEELQCALPYTGLCDSLPLLKRVLMYSTLRKACAEASAAAASHNEEARLLVEARKAAAQHSKSALFRHRAKQKIPSAQRGYKRRKQESKEIEHDQIKNLRMDAFTKKIFQSLNIPVRTLAGAGLFHDLCHDTSDEDEGGG
jgi:superfamily II DNA or RNA helicase